MKMSKPLLALFHEALNGATADTQLERWNALWASPHGNDLVQAAYSEGLNDNHIDTALRRVIS